MQLWWLSSCLWSVIRRPSLIFSNYEVKKSLIIQFVELPKLSKRLDGKLYKHILRVELLCPKFSSHCLVNLAMVFVVLSCSASRLIRIGMTLPTTQCDQLCQHHFPPTVRKSVLLLSVLASYLKVENDGLCITRNNIIHTL